MYANINHFTFNSLLVQINLLLVQFTLPMFYSQFALRMMGIKGYNLSFEGFKQKII
jgi:hypothetical protein